MENKKIPKRIRSEEHHRKNRERRAFMMLTSPEYRKKQNETEEKYRRKKGIKIMFVYPSKEAKRIAKNKRHVERYANDSEYRNRCLILHENGRRSKGISDYHSKRNITHKTCSKCKADLQIDNFRVFKKGSIHSICKSCEHNYHDEYNKMNMPIMLRKQKQNVLNLTDSYIRRKILRESKSDVPIPKEMIEVKRITIQIKRIYKDKFSE